MQKRIGFIGIIVKNRKKSAETVNKILSEHGEIILARMGVPCPTQSLNVITLVVNATTDEMGSLGGKLGALPEVTVKSALV